MISCYNPLHITHSMSHIAFYLDNTVPVIIYDHFPNQKQICQDTDTAKLSKIGPAICVNRCIRKNQRFQVFGCPPVCGVRNDRTFCQGISQVTTRQPYAHI